MDEMVAMMVVIDYNDLVALSSAAALANGYLRADTSNGARFITEKLSNALALAGKWKFLHEPMTERGRHEVAR